ncbi:MAG: cell division ATP-binding protein FtsE [Candidatus Zixiibacteriota bacterium]|nr:MAG: cell division ATP-binding protein FtsE [candidate division Zixibacteria bacterium]
MLEVKGVTKEYGGRITALSNVSFELEKGEMAFLTGASGAGKSTLLRLIFREEFPTSGEISLGPYNLAELPGNRIPDLRRHLGYVFQDFRLISERTAYENVALSLEVAGKSTRHIRKRVDEVMQQVGVWQRRKSYPRQLSGGEAQRVALARAIANEPLLLLADEPTGNLDMKNSRDLFELFCKLNLQGATVIVATHQVAMASEFGKRILHLEDGALKQDSK